MVCNVCGGKVQYRITGNFVFVAVCIVCGDIQEQELIGG